MGKKAVYKEMPAECLESSKKRKRMVEVLEEEEEEDMSPIRGVVCLKSRCHLKRYEETEECFILDFNPYDASETRELSFSNDRSKHQRSNDNDVVIVREKGQVACRDYPHPRHLCLKFPFTTTPHSSCCRLCYCYVCDSVAPCKSWTTSLRHCDASESVPRWKLLRDKAKGLVWSGHL